jgi:hypothetical protein
LLHKGEKFSARVRAALFFEKQGVLAVVKEGYVEKIVYRGDNGYTVLTLSMAGANLIYAIANGDGALYVSGNLLALAIGLFAGVRMTDMARSASQVTESEDAAQ